MGVGLRTLLSEGAESPSLEELIYPSAVTDNALFARRCDE